jgi:anthraniloyl-CoA monooxygenase
VKALAGHGRHWDAIEVRVHGQRERCGGNGMAAVVRKTLLGLLQERAAAAGVDLRFQHEVRDAAELEDFDLVVVCDGANSRFRGRFAAAFEPTVEAASVKFIWFGTTYLFDGLTFVHGDGPDGAFAGHAYPISDTASTFIVETDAESWLKAGLDEFDVGVPPGPSDEKTRTYLEQLFADEIDGHPLLTNNSRWANFRTWRTRRWRYGRWVLLGDAAHTAHFSVGSGTKMAMEDAVALAAALAEHRDDLDSALAAYEAARQPGVAKIQGSARPSLSWWEHFGQYQRAFDATQFTFHFLTRSISRGRLAKRDPGFVSRVDGWWRERHGTDPLRTPMAVAGVRLDRRLVDAPVPGTAWLDAPDDEAGLPRATAELDAAVDAGAPLVALRGGTRLTRVLLAEHARLARGVPRWWPATTTTTPRRR